MKLHQQTSLLFRVLTLLSCIMPLGHGGMAAGECQTRVEHIRSIIESGDSPGILVAAHRGHHQHWPENSIPSIQSAVEVGAHIVELDIRVSQDGVPVLMHDETLDRTTNGTGPVVEHTYQALQQLRLTDNSGELTDCHIPTFREALEAARGKILVNGDLKATDLDPILNVILDLEMSREVMFYHSNPEVLDSILQKNPEVMVMTIARGTEEVDRLLTHRNERMLHLRESYNSLQIAAQLDQHQTLGWTNALGEPDRRVVLYGPEIGFGPVVQNQPDIIQTDYPEALVQYLRLLRLPETSDPLATSAQPQ